MPDADLVVHKNEFRACRLLAAKTGRLGNAGRFFWVKAIVAGSDTVVSPMRFLGVLGITRVW
jgi:hypothetical protein